MIYLAIPLTLITGLAIGFRAGKRVSHSALEHAARHNLRLAGEIIDLQRGQGVTVPDGSYMLIRPCDQAHVH